MGFGGVASFLLSPRISGVTMSMSLVVSLRVLGIFLLFRGRRPSVEALFPGARSFLLGVLGISRTLGFFVCCLWIETSYGGVVFVALWGPG